MSKAAKVTVWTVSSQTVIEVDASDGQTLDRSWRERFASAGRQAGAPWVSTGPGRASCRVDTGRAEDLLALVVALNTG